MGAQRTPTPARGRRSGEAGFTISELVLVLGVLAALITIVVVSVGGIESGTQERDCRSELRALKAATETYKASVGSYPPDDQALDDAHVQLKTKSPNYDVSIGSDGLPVFTPNGDLCT